MVWFPTFTRQLISSRTRRHLCFSKPGSPLNLRTGDSIAGKIRPPKDGERYFIA